MKHLTLFFSLLFFVSACSTDTSNAPEASTNNETEVIPDRLLTIQIDGMVCEMGCGGSIRKELTKLAGVSAIEFDFEEERKTNTAKISFDKDKTTVDAIVKAITTLNDGQFKIGEISSESLSAQHVNQSNDESNEAPNVEVAASSYQMPNLLDFLASIVY